MIDPSKTLVSEGFFILTIAKTSIICYNNALYRGIVQRLVYGSPKPRIVVRFHVPLPRNDDQHPAGRFFVIATT
jgi:hypothetical protein